MKKIISLALDFSRKLKEIVSGIKTGVQFFKDLISGRLNLKKIVDDIIVALTSIPKKVNEFHIRREPNWSKKRWSRLKYIYHWPYLYPLIFARSFHIADEHWSLLSFTSIDGLQPFSKGENSDMIKLYWQLLKISISRTTWPIHKVSLGKGIQVLKNEGPPYSQNGDYNPFDFLLLSYMLVYSLPSSSLFTAGNCFSCEGCGSWASCFPLTSSNIFR